MTLSVQMMKKKFNLFVKPEDFEVVNVNWKTTHYHHIENGKKRDEILKKRMSGEMTQAEFEKEQKKMRGGKYLKFIFSESQYLKAISGLSSTDM